MKSGEHGRGWLSVLDFCDVDHDGLGRPCTTLELAMAAEALGYGRYWLAEHYERGDAHANALMLSLAVAAVTSTIRVGPAGVLLRFSHPFHVASAARLLESLFDERIDLGLAGAPGPRAMQAELQDLEGDPKERARQTLAYLRNRATHESIPRSKAPMAVWLLGSGTGMASVAAEQGTHLCVSLAHGPALAEPGLLGRYRDAFTPNEHCETPRTAILVACVCAESAADAERVCAERRNRFITPRVFGDPERCAEQLAELRHRYAADEVVVLDISRTYDARLRSLTLLAEATGLSPVAAASSAATAVG